MSHHVAQLPRAADGQRAFEGDIQISGTVARCPPLTPSVGRTRVMTITWRRYLLNLGYALAGLTCGILVTFLGPAWPVLLLVVIGTVIIVRFALWPRLRALAFTVGASVVPSLALFAFLSSFIGLDFWHRTRFDQATWNSQPKADEFMWPPRLCMVDDLLTRHDFHGWQRSNIISLLGEPDQTHWDADNQLVYYLGPERGLLGIDSEWLVFSLSSDEVVRDYKLARD